MPGRAEYICAGCGHVFKTWRRWRRGDKAYCDRQCYLGAIYDPQAVFNFIVEYKRAHDGIPPSYEQIRVGVGIASKSTVSGLLARLERAGVIKTADGHLSVVGEQWQPPTKRAGNVRPPRAGGHDPMEVYRFVVAYKLRHGGAAPTYDIISDGVGAGNRSSVAGIIRRLEAGGLIKVVGGRLMVVGGRWSFGRADAAAIAA